MCFSNNLHTIYYRFLIFQLLRTILDLSEDKQGVLYPVACLLLDIFTIHPGLVVSYVDVICDMITFGPIHRRPVRYL